MTTALPVRRGRGKKNNEIIRKETSRASLPWDEYHAPILTDFCRKMARSGYSQEYLSEVVTAGVASYERQLAASRAGEKPLFRPREWRKEERRKKKLNLRGWRVVALA